MVENLPIRLAFRGREGRSRGVAVVGVNGVCRSIRGGGEWWWKIYSLSISRPGPVRTGMGFMQVGSGWTQNYPGVTRDVH